MPGTTPYPWPWHGELDPERLALLLVSCYADDRPPPGDLAAVVRAAGGLVAGVRVRAPRPAAGESAASWIDMPVSAPGWADVPVSAPSWADVLVSVPGWDGFYAGPLDALLRRHGRDLLLLAGCCLETGVHSTLRSANDRGYECLLVADATRAARADLRAGAVSTIEMSGGIFGAVGASAAVAAALTGKE
ncbi:isochorismatase family protein [Nonomuraea rosea]|uniref:isochorismatase family protein n=1 Tax=Nonomuraea rosea TaxID=638574 RepID=UPI0031EBEBBC